MNESLSNDNPGTPTPADSQSEGNIPKAFERDEKGRYVPGHDIPGPGRPKEDEETKLIKKAQKELIAEYKQKLAEALPKIEPVLVAKALEGDIPAIKEVNDRVMGKAQGNLDITSGGNPIIQVAGEIAVKNKLYDPNGSPKSDSE